MAHFVNYGKYILKGIGVVQQDIRLAVIGAEAVCAAGLALILVDVHPAVGEAFVNL